jgi:hypothetical protein
MDTTSQINSIVENIVGTINNNVQAQVATQINQQIADVVAKMDLTELAKTTLIQRINENINRLPIDQSAVQAVITAKLAQVTDALIQQIQTTATASINETIISMVGKLDFQQMCQTTLITALQNQQLKFPDNSIPFSAVKSDTVTLTGDNVVGGIIQNFGSTGIDDKATDCRLSIFDEVTVVENNLVTKDLTVKGTTTIEGDLNITGTIPTSSPAFASLVSSAVTQARASLDTSLFQSYADVVYKQIRDNGLDLPRITVNGQAVIDGPSLSNGIVNSNLQSVGVLKELQTTGETFLSQTLYVTSKRVGVNTIQPSQALSIWDEEVEIGFGKLSVNTAVIGAPRTISLVLGSGGKNNITLTPDGTTIIPKLQVGTLSVTSSATPPGYEAPQGTIVFNEKPSLGGPLGWVSLGAANWANFGIVD